ncbi:MAG: hypothetical protein AAFR62_15575 [Cyanobacteria bacterium J06629_2]
MARSNPNKRLSIPCVVKQPGKPEVTGIVRQDLGDRFLVYLPAADSTVTIAKIYVYPDLGVQHNLDAEISPSKNHSPNSGETPRRPKAQGNAHQDKKLRRRKKGTGSGSIYYRTVVRNGTEYQQAYYHYKLDGKKHTKYIPQKLLGLIEAAEAEKRPVSEILILLGEKQINPSKSSSTFTAEPCRTVEPNTSNADISPSSGATPRRPKAQGNAHQDQNLSPSKNLRTKGEGSGSIHCKPIKRNGKEYKQYWYHYELWRSGERLVKKSRYVPKKLLTQVQRLEADKVPVMNILAVLGV